MRVDIDEPGLDFGDPVRIGGVLGLFEQRVTFPVGLQHDLDQAFRTGRRFLQQTPDLGALHARESCPDSAPRSPVMTLNSVVLPVPLRPTSPTRDAGRHAHRRFVEEQASGDADREVFDDCSMRAL